MSAQRMKHKCKWFKDTTKALNSHERVYVVGECNREDIVCWAKEIKVELIWSSNLEQDKYSTPYWSVKKEEKNE